MYNEKSRTENIIRTFKGYGISYLINLFVQFWYRTAFLKILSKEYLGLEGLFTNVIQILSLTELGIGTIIAYHLYEPIKKRDDVATAEIMYLYKIIYRVIAILIAIAGLFLLNWINVFIKDTAEIPENISIKVVYLLFLTQSVASYFFSYKQTILAADQRGDLLALILCIKNTFQYTLQILILKYSGNYVGMLVSSIILGVSSNAIISVYISKKYHSIFKQKVKLNCYLCKKIFKDTKAMLCHRIGGTVLNSTDNIIMSTYIGLGELGKLSNYSLISSAIQSLLRQVLGNFNGSIGNAHVSLSGNEKYDLYSKLQFINLWFASVMTICLYALINLFVIRWQGESMLLDEVTVNILIANFYLASTRYINISYTNACGLFNKDLVRPIIEAMLNLIFSLILVIRMGIAGIFVGTLISHIVTVWWREPYLLYKYEFEKPLNLYWRVYFRFSIVTLVGCCIWSTIGKNKGFGISTFGAFIISNAVLVFVNYQNSEMKFFLKKLSQLLKNR